MRDERKTDGTAAVAAAERMRHRSDASLVAAALLGSIPAFDELVRRYRAGVILAADGVLHCRAAAEDAAQDVFLLAFKALPSLEDPARFAGWLYAIARNRARRLAAREARARPALLSEVDALILASSDEIAAENARSADPERGAVRGAEREATRLLLECLKPEHREVLTLRYFEEWPLERIARLLSVPEATVRGRLYRARAALRALIEGEDGGGADGGTERRRRKGSER
jgi:RNA polymerase sigma-70 factor (ECF subfamily)